MRFLIRPIFTLAVSSFVSIVAYADESTLSDYRRIFSTSLGYELQYRIYKPVSVSADDRLPSLYVTDGQGYLAQGRFKTVLDEAISSGVIKPLVVVFLDSRNPDKLQENRRNNQFMCNEKFATFFCQRAGSNDQ